MIKRENDGLSWHKILVFILKRYYLLVFSFIALCRVISLLLFTVILLLLLHIFYYCWNLLSATRCILQLCEPIRKAWFCTIVSLFNFNNLQRWNFPNRPMEILLKSHRHRWNILQRVSSQRVHKKFDLIWKAVFNLEHFFCQES